jgi:prevent-host-death family protein
MKSFQVVEAKAKFSSMLSMVEDGQTVAITRHGKIVAKLVPEKSKTAGDLFRLANKALGGASLEPPEDKVASPVQSF